MGPIETSSIIRSMQSGPLLFIAISWPLQFFSRDVHSKGNGLTETWFGGGKAD